MNSGSAVTMGGVKVLGLLALSATAGLPLAAQPAVHGQSPLDSIAAETAELSARYADRRVAIADGYRPVGGDFPGMGEHWLHPGTLLANRLDAARPTLLVYAAVEGRPRLLGAGFVVAARSHEEAARLPGWPAAWHEHSGLLADESGVDASRPNTSGTRVWVLHIWTALPNQDGPYAPDNWSLPFARLGVAAPPGVDADAGRAMALAVGGDRHLRGVLTDAGLLTSTTAVKVDSIIDATTREVGRIAAGLRNSRAVTVHDAERLRGEWRELAASLRELLGTAVDPYLKPPHPRDAAHPDEHPASH